MPQPNILLITVEHWSARFLGCAGHQCIMTPTLDSLAANGVRFTNALSPTPTCIPARRELMTGTSAKTHGDRVFNQLLQMPNLPALADIFSQSGYQTYAAGKLHVYPQRDRIGFDDVILNEEGRHHLGLKSDDYELYLAEHGYVGQEFTDGMCNNSYIMRPWHLPEHCHPTNWTVQQMCKIIKRRDPKRPSFWYMSFSAPHPPLSPLDCYLRMYDELPINEPFIGSWAENFESLPYVIKRRRKEYFGRGSELMNTPHGIRLARQAYYALCTHVDHQIRLVIGMLREEGLLDNTIIAFTADHGEMLGNHGLFAKDLMFEDSVKVPLIIVPTADYRHFGHHIIDDRLVELKDIMPTLLDMADIEIPNSVEGMSLLTDQSRQYTYAEHYEDERSVRMIRNNRFKLIYYPVGNAIQLFDLDNDQDELCDISEDSEYSQIRQKLISELIKNMYGCDQNWTENQQLVGVPNRNFTESPQRGLQGQRGWRFL